MASPTVSDVGMSGDVAGSLLQQVQRGSRGSIGQLVRKNSLSIHDARIAGLYDLEQTIGKGHFAVVKLARHVFTGEKVAVKVIDKTKLDPVSRVHIMQEVRCMKLVQHPYIVRLYEVIDTQTKLFLILELGDHDMYDFMTHLGEGVGCPEHVAQRHFCQIIQAIDYCHALHVVHRDLKPENVVFFEKLGMVKLTDFGFSNLYTPGQQLETSCGSLAYSAPEILLGDAYDAPAVDVWSLGVILYMLVCGKLPFNEANDSETLTKILDCAFLLPDTLSQDCQDLIRSMLVREPSERIHISEILNHAWVQAGYTDHVDVLPLIKRHQLPDVAHDTIVQQMVHGRIATPEDIQHALETDDYSYISATYYLLAERVLSKQREEEAARLLQMAARSDPHLVGKPPEESVRTKNINGVNVPCYCLDATIDQADICPCVQEYMDGTEVSGGDAVVQKPDGDVPTTTAVSAPIPVVASVRSRSNSWRQPRPCTMVKEESEEELSQYFKSSRPSSRASSPGMGLFGTSPSLRDRCVSPQAIQEMLELTTLTTRHENHVGSGGASSGRRTPDSRRSSRSPSPPSSSGRASPSAVAQSLPTRHHFPKPPASLGLRKLSSSPHLFGICEEGEEESGSVAEGNTGGTAVDTTPFSSGLLSTKGKRPSLPPPTTTYSSVRMIRPRHAVVSPDVIRRYERIYGGGGAGSSRSRRSTSCSSSEASDDDSERRYGLIASKYCNRKGDDDEDKDPPAAGGGASSKAIRRLSAHKTVVPPSVRNSTGTMSGPPTEGQTKSSNTSTRSSALKCGHRVVSEKDSWCNEKETGASWLIDASTLIDRLEQLIPSSPASLRTAWLLDHQLILPSTICRRQALCPSGAMLPKRMIPLTMRVSDDSVQWWPCRRLRTARSCESLNRKHIASARGKVSQSAVVTNPFTAISKAAAATDLIDLASPQCDGDPFKICSSDDDGDDSDSDCEALPLQNVVCSSSLGRPGSGGGAAAASSTTFVRGRVRLKKRRHHCSYQPQNFQCNLLLPPVNNGVSSSDNRCNDSLSSNGKTSLQSFVEVF